MRTIKNYNDPVDDDDFCIRRMRRSMKSMTMERDRKRDREKKSSNSSNVYIKMHSYTPIASELKRMENAKLNILNGWIWARRI